MLKKYLNKYSLMVLAGSMVVGLSSEGCGGSDSTNDDSVLKKKIEKLEKEKEVIKAEKANIEKEKTTLADDTKKKDEEIAKLKAGPKPDVTKDVKEIKTEKEVDEAFNNVVKESEALAKEEKQLHKSFEPLEESLKALENGTEEEKADSKAIVDVVKGNAKASVDLMKKHGALIKKGIELLGKSKKNEERKKSLEERRKSLEKRKEEIKQEEIIKKEKEEEAKESLELAKNSPEDFVDEFWDYSDQRDNFYNTKDDKDKQATVVNTIKATFQKTINDMKELKAEERNKLIAAFGKKINAKLEEINKKA